MFEFSNNIEFNDKMIINKVKHIKNSYELANILIMSTKTLLFLLLTFLLIINVSQCQLIYSRRVSIPETTISNMQQQYDVLYKQDGSIVYNQTNNMKYDVVISINSFTQGSRIKVSVIGMKRNTFTVQTHNVNELSYILVQISETWKVGSLCLYFPSSGLIPHNSLITTSHQIKSPSQILHQLATVQPFISQLSLSPMTFMQISSLKSTAIVNLEWSWYTNNLTIVRSPDIRKVCVSYFMYVKLSNRNNNLFFNVRRPTGLEFFQYRRSRERIFLGLRSVEIEKGGSQPQYGNKAYLQWQQSLRANLNGVTPQIYLLLEQQTKCSQSSILDAIYNPADPTLCLNECYSKIIIVQGRKICIQNISVNASLATPISMVEVVRQNNGNVCEIPGNASQFLACKKCNSTSYFTELYDNSCFCKIGYYGYVTYPQQSSQTNYYVDNEWMWTCRPCDSQTCVFQPSMSASLVLNSMNNSYAIQINLSYNNTSQNIKPYGDTKYSNIQLSISINTQQTSYTVSTTQSPSIYKLLLPTITYSPNYNYSIEIKSKSSIVLIHQYPQYRAQIIYLTQPFKLTQSVSLQKTSSLLASSIENISNSIAITSLVSLMLGAKLSLFSFMQVSSIMYLSMFVKWKNYGSIDRLNLLRMLFRMEPSNLIASLGAHLNITKLYSDDSNIGNVALNHYQNQLYITLVPQYFMSALINVIIVQAIIQILTRILNPPLSPQSHLPFHKPRYLTTHILSQTQTIKQKLSKSISNSLPKRLTFYLTLFSSQLAYHSFMIFSQFHIHLSTTTQIINLFFALTMLGIIFGIVAVGSSHPMVLFKAVGVLAKKRQYTYVGLYLYWVVSAMEMIVYGASLAIFTQSYSQCLPLIMITVLKLMLANQKIKPLELIKSIFLSSYFIILSVGTLFSVENQKILQQCTIFLIILICVLEFAKILRSIVVLIIGILRGKLSTDGIAIIQKVKIHLRKQSKQKQEQEQKNKKTQKAEQLKNKSN